MAPEICPNCGTDVPRTAKACPECGADETSGWADDAYADRLGLPEEKFDYANFVKDEFEGGKRIKPRGLAWIWWVTALLLLLLLALAYFR